MCARCAIRTILLFSLIALPPADAADWPMWRCDAQRTAASTERLSKDLSLIWTRRYAARKQAWDDPLNLDLMTYDRVFEPIVMGGRMFVGFNDRDRLSAFDAQTGEKLWSFFADSPIRLAPVGWRGKVYVTSDDGVLYCLDAATGNMKWKFRGAPNEQKALGNERLTSAWPARGGPVVRDETVYFAASIWPMMGTFVYALDAESGAVEWVNDSTGSQYIKQPHSAPSFAGVAPQGAFVATRDFLVVPGGRSVPAVFDRADGTLRYFEINAGGKGTGGTFVASNDTRFFVHTRLKGTRAFDLETGVKTAFMPNEPVIADGIVYTAELDGDRPVVRAYNAEDKVEWEVDADGRGDLILAGETLYAAHSGTITTIRLPHDSQPPVGTESLAVDGQVERLLAADGKLFAVTLEGSVFAFGEGRESKKVLVESSESLAPTHTNVDLARDLLGAGDAEGYAFWFGATNESLLEAIADNSPFVQLAIVDPDQETVDRLRQRLDAAGLYGRVTAHAAEPRIFQAPQYVAHMMFVDGSIVEEDGVNILNQLYQSVRPYGGTLHVLIDSRRGQVAEQIRQLDLEQAKVEVTDHGVLITRVGPLPGSADWTHQYGDVANTIKSNDERVRLPLGVLWFGGSSNMDVLPRHGHGPPEQVIGGRLIIQGMNSLSARDVYTGRVLWKRTFDDLGTFDVYYDETYEDTPLDPQYNQVHIPGANGRGTNYVVTDDRVYLLEGETCHVLDPVTGKTLQDLQLPADDSGQRPEWGYIGVYEDLLLAGHGFAQYRQRHGLKFEADTKLRRSRAGFGSKSLDRAASVGLVAFDRRTGEVLWHAQANHSFWHNGIVAGGGRIYCLDRKPELIEDALRRRGITSKEGYRIVSFDADTGDQVWEVKDNIFGTWLGYSAEYDLLLQAGAAASDRLYAEVGEGMAVYHAADGKLNWENRAITYAGPCILHNDWIITNANSYTESQGAFRLTDGTQKLVENPLTGEFQPWKLTRAYGCNNIIASEHLLTFRSGAAGFYDLSGESGTGNFGGFKSGCTSNLVVANGVLNAPDYTRTCSCAYQNQTSLALVHMPELEFWTNAPSVMGDFTESRTIKRIGINFGAPGDRRDDNGVLWLEYPPVSGPSAPLNISLNPEAKFDRRHSSAMQGEPLSWVLASGVQEVTDVSISMSLQDKVDLRDGIPVSHPDDDAEEQPDGSVSLSSSDLELVDDGGTQTIGLRFNGINLKQDGQIRSAHLQFVCDEPTEGPTSLIIAGQNSGHSERFTGDGRDVTSRPRTKAEISWRPDAWTRPGEAGEAQRTPDITPLIHEIVSRPDWQPGNSMAFFVTGVGKRVAASSRGGRDTGAVRLIIDGEEATSVRNSSADGQSYQVRLFFAAPGRNLPEFTSFDLAIQDQVIAENLSLDATGSKASRTMIHTVSNVLIDEVVRIQVIPRHGSPQLSGIELIRSP